LKRQLLLIIVVGALAVGSIGVSQAHDVGTVPEQRAGVSGDYELLLAEIYTDPASGELGRTVYFSDRGNKQLGHHFVPGDPRRGGGTNITFMADSAEGGTASGLTAGQTSAAIRSAMHSWQAQNCSTIPLVDLGDAGGLGPTQAWLGFGDGAVLADVMHAGWLPGAFFDALAPGGSGFILGVTFTWVFVDAAGEYTDIDNNGKLDVAFRDIYYNNNFSWNIGDTFDVETVALHEAGHGLSQAHFGEAFRNKGNDKVKFNPRAVMNAAYSGVQTALTGTDNGGHCSVWASWPNN